MISADKRFGQHFLTNAGIINKIADGVEAMARNGDETRTVFEIGPGPGALTDALLARGLTVVAVELDPRMEPELNERFKSFKEKGHFRLLMGDALHIPLESLRHEMRSKRALICGNLPYNVGSQIVFRFLESFPEADRFSYMLQKEVVLKFLAGSKAQFQRRDFGPPGVKLHWCARVRDHFWVSPGSFQPPPQVDSGVFSFERLSEGERMADPCQRGGLYDRAGEIVHRAFQNRRKMLRASFPELAPTPWATKRAEELTPRELLDLCPLIESARKSG